MFFYDSLPQADTARWSCEEDVVPYPTYLVHNRPAAYTPVTCHKAREADASLAYNLSPDYLNNLASRPCAILSALRPYIPSPFAEKKKRVNT
jgi:hypothetical protein